MYYNTKASGARIRELRIAKNFTQDDLAELLLPDPHCSPSDSPQRQETASAHTLSAFLREGHGRRFCRSSGADQNHRQTPRGAHIGRVSREQMDGVNEALQISLGLFIPEEMEAT